MGATAQDRLPSLAPSAERQPEGFQLEVRRRPRTTVIALSGELDLIGAPKVEQAVADVAASESRGIVIDLGQLEFMDVSGLQAVLVSQRRARAAGGRCAVVNANEQVSRLFRLTDTDHCLESRHVKLVT